MGDLRKDQEVLLQWYSRHRRSLPWRVDRNPYRIWISEVMLQQTTVQAVVPYYDSFMKRFPDLESLAASPEADVLALWSGLGYYSRAKNLHKAAQRLSGLEKFPQTHVELARLPGFGPYTSRAVSSIAFGEKVGAVDGNLIRVLSRRFALDLDWWAPAGRQVIQELADKLVEAGHSSETNQALMDLGSSVCLARNPRCGLCPLARRCLARRQGREVDFPKAKPRRRREVWVWRPQVTLKRRAAGLVRNDYAPFLRGHFIWPGTAELKKSPPKRFDYRHSVTHHDIFVVIDKRGRTKEGLRWIPLKDLKKEAPSSLVRKALQKVQEKL